MFVLCCMYILCYNKTPVWFFVFVGFFVVILFALFCNIKRLFT